MRQSIDIAAAPQIVWALVADPVRMAEWHPKIVSVTPITAGPPRQGARYRITYRMRKREQAVNSMIEDFAAPMRMVMLHIGEKERRVRETFDLAPSANGHTTLRHEIDLSHFGIAWPLRLFIWFINRFGEPQGTGPLEELKRRIEEAAVSPSPQNR